MSSSSRFKSPSSAALPLLLGLLALLLWGQCSALINAGRSSAPIAADFYTITRVDSLSKAAPDGSMKVYMKLEFSNYLPFASKLDSVRGHVSFEGQQWAFSATDQAKGLLVARKQTRLVPVVLLITGAKSIEELRRAFYIGSTGGNSLRQAIDVTYFTSYDFELRRKSKGASYLPMVTPRL